MDKSRKKTVGKPKLPTGDERRYRICESILTWDVEKEVNELMAKGWKPLGNLLALRYEEEGRKYTKFIQAMVRNLSQR